MKIRIGVMNDLIQEARGNLIVPEIRVWCHPHYIGKKGDDYYRVFDTFKDAIDFIAQHDEAEEIPMIAFNGKEINIFVEVCKND